MEEDRSQDAATLADWIAVAMASEIPIYPLALHCLQVGDDVPTELIQ